MQKNKNTFAERIQFRNDIQRLSNCTLPIDEYVSLLDTVTARAVTEHTSHKESKMSDNGTNVTVNEQKMTLEYIHGLLLLSAVKKSRIDVVECLFSRGAKIADRHGMYLNKFRTVLHMDITKTAEVSSMILQHILSVVETDTEYRKHIINAIAMTDNCMFVFDRHINYNGMREMLAKLYTVTSVYSTDSTVAIELELAQKSRDLANLQIAYNTLQVKHGFLQDELTKATSTLTQAMEILNDNSL